ncbi:FHA domain-containing protein [[Clostridium] innocuum]|uniref:FtsK/SpoIIIE domain-containing protein n=1 Tax=Clostridium TaxID=1485 RepID=UPI001A9A18ED|nr:FtsK/SpoIIIE domain-containing protein [[Clostridium] innocuum]MCI2993430.1 FHA domain-containing protein [[Clostridium] innocuum]MCI2994632.1 FHA domain-containing protein [[Clostridium] innocuum]MCI3011489.1 FHA domain-containing protein [[Clostridium] innocuum]MCR0135446.1 FHA domain-containing protein [[Clostridium] innocuum]MCR0146189.1 FHA domain-containing protein [[Clostridium] innocuum]
MQRIKLCVLQDKGIQTVLLINQRKTVPVYQYRDVAVQAVWRIGGWSFHVTQSASPLYQLHKKEIEPGFHCVIALEGQRIRFYAEELCANALRFHGYALVGIVHIGRSSTQELCLKSAGISLCHALLQAKDTEWELVDQASTNGCYVNGDRITRHTVVPGDVIYLGNVMLLMGKDSIFVPEQIADTRLSEISYCKTVIEEKEAGTAICLTPEPVQKLTMEIELPLAKGTQENLPAIFVLGPSITMGLSSTAMGLFSFWLAAERKQDLLSVVPTLLMSLSMALGTILWPLLSKRYERKQQRRKEEKRCYVYSCYLLEVKQRIQQAMQEETAYLQHWYPPVSKLCVDFLAQKPYRLRCVNHADWLHVVLGQGSCPAGVDLQIPHVSSMTQDVLLDKLHGLQAGQFRLENVPIVADLRECQSLCLEGERSVCIDTLLNILLQLVIQQPEKETRICIAADKALISREKLFCLPHLFVDRQRLLVWDETSAGRCRRLLEAVVDDEGIKDVIVCILEPCLTDSLQLPAHEKIHQLRWSDTLNNAADLQLQINGRSVRWPQRHADFTIDTCTERQRRAAFVQRSAYPKDSARGKKMLSFLKLFHCHSVEELQIASRYQGSDAAKSLRVIIGQSADGGELYLDAHEHSHGPHGLLAGMTGSGKSECLLTYLLSLAVTFSCQDVSFLLIDFKGGTMANALAKLPHTAGIITNLDKGILMRCMCAIEGELTRRQQQLADTGERYGISSMDIDKYMQLRKQHPSLTAMPHLFLVADEFAELKQLFPAVLDHLRQCARIGRSLGIHLLLATQKPFGVVDEQIWSNARFRLCLKVADRNDSMDMLKKDSAVHLQHPGQLFLQVGHDEVFVQGQSAWTQAPYDPCGKEASDLYLSYYDSDGNMQDLPMAGGTVAKTELEAVCDALCAISTERAAPLWMPPLKPNLQQEELPAKETALTLGLLDDLAHQQQIPFSMSVWDGRNLAVCGMVGSGKSMFVETLIQSCLVKSENILYLFDFDKPLFMKYAQYQQVAAVFQREDAEGIQSFFSFMRRMIKQRRAQRSEQGILCILHNYEVFHELYQELEEELLYLLREGKKYGIVCCITTAVLQQIPMRIQACLEDWYALQCAQHEDYSYLFSCEQSCIPLTQPGCGLMKYNDTLCMFQIAVYRKEAWMKASRSQTPPAYAVPRMPAHVSHPLAMQCDSSFLGREIKTQEEIYTAYPTGRCLFLLAAYRLNDSFISLYLKQLETGGSVHIFSPHPLAKRKPSSLDTLDRLLKQPQKQYIVWHQLDELTLDTAFMKKLLEAEQLHHIFIETIPHLSAYSLWDWYAPVWLDAAVLWMGKGFQEHSYTLKRNVQTDKILKSKEAIYWEEDTCRILQLWEVEENG